MFENVLLAVKQIPGNQFFLTKWISIIFGYIINFIFDIVHHFTVSNSLGISLIFLTLIARVLMIPIAVKQQKSMFVMNKMQPEMKKIQDKYAGREKDPEISRKMQMDMQKLYAKYNYNPFSGCLPMLIQLPIFIALYYVMQNPYLYINTIADIYSNVGDFINSLDADMLLNSGLYNVIASKVPDAQNADLSALIQKILGVFTINDWELLKGVAAGNTEILNSISNFESIVTFCGINLTENVSDNLWNFSNFKFLIPLVSGLSTFLSSWLMTKKTGAVNETARQQQKVMNVVMPFFMAFITLNLPCGVGVYWITSNLFQIAQQIIINNVYTKKLSAEEVKK